MNLHITPEFERELETVMRLRGLKSRSEAVRQAVHDAAQVAAAKPTMREWLERAHGISAEGALPAFDDDELWEGTDPDADARLTAKRNAAA